MKTLKPVRVSTMTRPFLHEGRTYLAMTVVAMTDMRGEEVLLPEPALWKTLTDELGSETAFDLAMPKASAEFLVTGSAYTAHQDDKTRCAVSVRVGRRVKSLTVHGDRFWLDGRASDPQPFESLRLGWQVAYGGQGFAENPSGIGHDEELVNGVRVHRVPNLQHPGDVFQPGREARPAGLDVVDIARPSRAARMGRQYDEQWKRERFPGFAADMDWHFFNAAPEDQWLGDGDELAGADYEILNMHPQQPVQRGRLPDWRARGFIVRGAIGNTDPAAGAFEPMALRLSTAWFFPGLERVALVYHGSVPIAEDDAADVSHAMVAMEEADSTPHSLAHYRAILDLRCDTEHGGLYTLRDDQLLPSRTIGPWLEDEDDLDPLSRNMRIRAERERAKLTAAFKASGGDPARYALPPAPTMKMPALNEFPAYIAKLKDLAKTQREQAEAARAGVEQAARLNAPQSRKVGFDTSTFPALAATYKGKGPPVFDGAALVRGVLGVAPAVGVAPLPADKQAQLHKVAEDSKSGMLALYRRMAHYQDAADPMGADEAMRTRAEVARILGGSRDFSDMDFTGADLSGMDLRGARWHRTLLESANLEGCNLEGGDFGEAVLARVRLTRASLRETVFKDANLAMALCEDTDFTGARFHRCALDKLQARRCNFSGVEIDEQPLVALVLEDCGFQDARITQAHWVERCVLRNVRFDRARLHKVSWVACEMRDVGFASAEFESCSWLDVHGGDGIDLGGARMLTTCFVGQTRLENVRLQGAVLKECSLRGIPLNAANLSGARLENSDLSGASMHGADLSGADASGSLFVRSDFTGASLRGANLQASILQKAILVGADLRGANLFRADISQCLADEHTRFDAAYTEQIKTVPMRRKAQVE